MPEFNVSSLACNFALAAWPIGDHYACLLCTMHIIAYAHHWIRTFDLSLVFKAYHLRREETDWFDKPRESRLENGHPLDRRLPEKLSHSRPPSQHQDQISCQVSRAFTFMNV